jgi:hypothetical protein
MKFSGRGLLWAFLVWTSVVYVYGEYASAYHGGTNAGYFFIPLFVAVCFSIMIIAYRAKLALRFKNHRLTVPSYALSVVPIAIIIGYPLFVEIDAEVRAVVYDKLGTSCRKAEVVGLKSLRVCHYFAQQDVFRYIVRCDEECRAEHEIARKLFDPFAFLQLHKLEEYEARFWRPIMELDCTQKWVKLKRDYYLLYSWCG